MGQAQTIEALKAAVADVRLNGREGRTVQQIADTHGVKVASLRTKLVHAGLTHLNHKTQSCVTIESCDGQKPFTELDSKLDGSPNSLQDKSICQLSSNLVGNRGKEGVTTAPMPGAHSSGGFHVENACIGPERSQPNTSISEADKAILEVKTEVVKEYRRMLREAKRQVEIKNVRDYKAVADHLLELLGDSKGSSKSAPLIQVTILGDSGNRDPRMIRAINDSGNDSGLIETESVAV